DNERMLIFPVLTSRQKNLIEARRAAVENAQTILSAFHLEKWLNPPVDCVLVPEKPIGIQSVEDRWPVLVKQHIVQDQRDIVLIPSLRVPGPTGQSEPLAFVARVLIIKKQEETCQTRINIGRGEIHHVVVVPQSGQLLLVIVAQGKAAVVMVPILSRTDVVHWITVAL